MLEAACLDLGVDGGLHPVPGAAESQAVLSEHRLAQGSLCQHGLGMTQRSLPLLSQSAVALGRKGLGEEAGRLDAWRGPDPLPTSVTLLLEL